MSIVETCDLCAGMAVVDPGEPRLCDPNKHAIDPSKRPTARQVTYLLAHWYWTVRQSLQEPPTPAWVVSTLAKECPDILQWARKLQVQGENFDGVFGQGSDGETCHREMFLVMKEVQKGSPRQDPIPAWVREVAADSPLSDIGLSEVIFFGSIAIICILFYFFGQRP